jgi:antitoxin ParD1/3/4
MNVSLTPELQDLVSRKVADGRYASASEVVRDALRLLEERDELRAAKIDALKRKVAAGLESLDAGRVSNSTADDIIRKARARYDI